MSVRTIRYNTIEQHFTKSALASTDRDALAFLEAAQIYNTNQQRAIVNLVRSLKRTGLWSKMKAIYPFIGGTATSHKWNLKDPQDTDAAFRLTFSGGITHNANGITGNGTNGYANTNLNYSTNLAQNSWHESVYSRTSNATATRFEIAVTNVNPFATSGILFYNAPPFGTYFGAMSSTSPYYAFIDSTITKGHYINTRTASTTQKGYRDGSTIASSTFASSAHWSLNAFVLARNNATVSGGAEFYSISNLAFASIGDGLTDTDATNLYNIVDLYQKRLGRAV